MIKSVKVETYLGDVLVMELARPELSGFAITNISGIGPEKSNINITEVATMDGGIYNSSRLNARNIVIDLIFWKTEIIRNDEKISLSIEDIRQLSYKYFPIKRNVSLTIITDNRACKIDGYIEGNEPNIFSEQEGTQISIICPNPFFYDANRMDEVTLYGTDPLFEFPFSNESLHEPLLEMGEIKTNFFATIKYSGDDEVGINIMLEATGPVTDITIYNIDTREKMMIKSSIVESIIGSPIQVSDTIHICTEKGNKSAVLKRAEKTYNILSAIGKTDTWFQLAKGDNLFGFSCASGRTNLIFKISNKILYEGV